MSAPVYSHPPSGPCDKCDRTGRLVSYRYGVADCDACDGVGWLYPKAALFAHAAAIGNAGLVPEPVTDPDLVLTGCEHHGRHVEAGCPACDDALIAELRPKALADMEALSLHYHAGYTVEPSETAKQYAEMCQTRARRSLAP